MIRDETIFLTGFPGFIATRLLRRLSTEANHFLLLVQPALVEQAKREIQEIADRAGEPVKKFQILEGDITRPDLSLSARDRETACSETTVIFHLAALYDLAVTRGTALTVNVDGTRHINEFARQVRALHHYHYVSTCYVAGKREGRIFETELQHAAGFRNFYEETKYLAEMEVEALKAKLPTTIHRPAVVCGDSKTGATAKYDGVYYLIRYLLRWPRLLCLFNIGNQDVSLNLVPVDFLVEAMLQLAGDERAIGKTLQLADPNPLTTQELFDTIACCLTGRKSFVTIPAPWVQFSLMLPPSPAITGLPHHGVPYFFVRQTYDTREADELLGSHNLKCPPFRSYAKVIVEYAARHGH